MNDKGIVQVGGAFLLSQIGFHAAYEFGVLLSQVDLNPKDAGILRMLGATPGLTQQALSEKLKIFPSRLVQLLDSLEKRGLIIRKKSLSDRRSHSLELTEAGISTLANVGQITKRLEEGLFQGLTPDELAGLIQVLQKIVVNQGLGHGAHPAFRNS